MRPPVRNFDPEDFSRYAESVYGHLGLEPRHGSMLINGKKVPVLRHEFFHQHVGNMSTGVDWQNESGIEPIHTTVNFKMPTEYGTYTNVDIGAMHFGGSKDADKFIARIDTPGDIISHPDRPNLNRVSSDWSVSNQDYLEGPDHLNDLLMQHQRQLREALQSGHVRANDGTRAMSEKWLSQMRTTSPEDAIKAHWTGSESKGYEQHRGTFDPLQRFRFARNRHV